MENRSEEKNSIRLKFTNDIRRTLDEASTVVITDNNGVITYVNEKFCTLSKYSEKELLGKHTRILKSTHHSSEFFSKLWKTISNGKTWQGDIRNKAKDGTFYWVKTTIVPSFDKNQNIQNYISIRTDITTQIELAEKLVKLERLSSIGLLAARMAHDIKNPLSVIKISIENLKIQFGINNSKQKLFEKIDHSINRISHQIDDVLDFVNKNPLELNRIKMSDVISESRNSMIIPDNIEIIIQNNNVEFIGDKLQLTIAMNNLILNGIQAIDGTGTVEITVEENDDVIIIQVKDSGKGIPKEHLDQVFEPLFTTKQKGTGLGLASVKSIIDIHEGMISVTSPPTIFTITLPKKTIQDNIF